MENVLIALFVCCVIGICTTVLWMALSKIRLHLENVYLLMDYLCKRFLNIDGAEKLDYIEELRQNIKLIAANTSVTYINSKEGIKILEQIKDDLSTILEDISEIEKKEFIDNTDELNEIKDNLISIKKDLETNDSISLNKNLNKLHSIYKGSGQESEVLDLKQKAKDKLDKLIAFQENKDKEISEPIQETTGNIYVYPWNRGDEWRKKFPQRLRWDLVPEDRRITPEMIIAYRGENNGRREADSLENCKCEMAIDWGSRWGKRFGVYKRCAKPVSEGKTCCALHAKLPKSSDPEEDEKELIEELKKESGVKE